MRCFIYKGVKKADTYLYVAKQDEFSQVPDDLLAMLGTLTLVMPLDLSNDQKLAQADPKQVLQQLSQQGYYLQLPPSDLF